jgi:hypothetical protein
MIDARELDAANAGRAWPSRTDFALTPAGQLAPTDVLFKRLM